MSAAELARTCPPWCAQVACQEDLSDPGPDAGEVVNLAGVGENSVIRFHEGIIDGDPAGSSALDILAICYEVIDQEGWRRSAPLLQLWGPTEHVDLTPAQARRVAGALLRAATQLEAAGGDRPAS